jgi:hypothetical protein
MGYFKTYVGSIIFAIGVAGIIWLIRNFLRPYHAKALFYTRNPPFIIFLVILVFIIGGLGVYSNFEKVPLIGLLLGVFIGWFVSRGKYL